jgi:Mn-dependent DtxR family transcriptional regulator
MARSTSGESVLTRAVRIFEAFTPDETVLSVTQIARRARLHPATASRLVAELEAHGLLAREPDRRVRDRRPGPRRPGTRRKGRSGRGAGESRAVKESAASVLLIE